MRLNGYSLQRQTQILVQKPQKHGLSPAAIMDLIAFVAGPLQTKNRFYSKGSEQNKKRFFSERPAGCKKQKLFDCPGARAPAELCLGETQGREDLRLFTRQRTLRNQTEETHIRTD